ncbi:sphingomyelin phosphodiesterase 1-like [Leptopilina heterotoma]|uniref:sphingomyelin phosphodiesterase 1-like n=1 Tax=Leptopilina heterotoma TaxID=63436 RepID=UPI001CA7EF6F|nr:sphingomyelin phosphodiesterase 1-like [Leptopilina heterotoma]
MKFITISLCCLTFCAVLVATNSLNILDIKADILSTEIELWVKSGIKSSLLKQAIKALALPTALQRKDFKALEGIQAITICTICNVMVKTIVILRKGGTAPETISKSIADLCTLFNLQTEEVCSGVVQLNAPIILKIVDAKPNIKASDVCGVILQSQACSTSSSEYNWSIDVDDSEPKLIPTTNDNEMMKILQITDIHYDPNYEVNGNAGCAEPTCCRMGQNSTNKRGKLAKYWGDYNFCDAPWHAVVDALDHMKNTHSDVDYIYFTGDIIDHGVWETTLEDNAKTLTKSYNLMKETFPNKMIFPILGNHEPNPVNVFAPHDIEEEELSTVWLYKLLADLWINYGWLPESTRATILRGGFYTVSPRKGFRIIVMNNNVCYTYNWWILYQPKDQDGQLKWLMETLHQAENDNEFVHILAHIPPGDNSCLVAWSRAFRKIVNRYSHIISAQFNGHTHNDELKVFYSPDDNSKIINVAWNGGSITTYSNLNPNYKIYEINGNDYKVEDYETWIYNLTAANETPDRRPDWFKLYSFKEEYNLSDTSPNSLNNWLVEMSKDDKAILKYHRNFVKYADPALKENCNSKCLKKQFCSIVTSQVNNKKECTFFENLNSPIFQMLNNTEIGVSVNSIIGKVKGTIFG